MTFVKDYFSGFQKTLDEFLSSEENCRNLSETADLLRRTKETSRKIFLIGNGGSSAIAEHMAIDLTKNAGLCAQAFSGTPMLTTFSNDYGYDRVFEKCVETFVGTNDVVIVISSGGESQNIIRACEAAKNKDCHLITFTGFDENNSISKLGRTNFYLKSRAYGYVEIIHNLLIHCINDEIIGEAEYFFKGEEL